MILENFNLSVEHTERVGLAAPSGYGKTTLCMPVSYTHLILRAGADCQLPHQYCTY